jgi:hypothetical protein
MRGRPNGRGLEAGVSQRRRDLHAGQSVLRPELQRRGVHGRRVHLDWPGVQRECGVLQWALYVEHMHGAHNDVRRARQHVRGERRLLFQILLGGPLRAFVVLPAGRRLLRHRLRLLRRRLQQGQWAALRNMQPADDRIGELLDGRRYSLFFLGQRDVRGGVLQPPMCTLRPDGRLHLPVGEWMPRRRSYVRG